MQLSGRKKAVAMELSKARHWLIVITIVILSIGWTIVPSEAVAGQAPAVPQTARESAPFDPTGLWVAVITEDWRWRMMVPKQGDVTSIPVNDAGLKAAREWDAARDAAAGEHCKPFGAGGVMRLPLRLRVSWVDNQTLKVETEAGQQTRLFPFLAPAVAARGAQQPVMGPVQPAPASAASLQGTTVARWNANTLEAVTNNTTGGYLRRNGVPYSADALIREYWNVHTDFGQQWLSVTTVVHDPAFLRMNFITSSSFKKLADGGGEWAPFPCEQL